MLTAILDGKRVYARDMTDRTLPYHDEINQKMILVKGTIVVHHFRHKPSERAPYETEPESEMHMFGKDMIYTQLKKQGKEVELEHVELSIKRRADVICFTDKTVYEIQCSPISKPKIDERTKDWNTLGYDVKWVFYKDFNKDLNRYKLRVTAAQAELSNVVQDCDAVDMWYGSLYIFNKKGFYKIHLTTLYGYVRYKCILKICYIMPYKKTKIMFEKRENVHMISTPDGFYEVAEIENYYEQYYTMIAWRDVFEGLEKFLEEIEVKKMKQLYKKGEKVKITLSDGRVFTGLVNAEDTFGIEVFDIEKREYSFVQWTDMVNIKPMAGKK